MEYNLKWTPKKLSYQDKSYFQATFKKFKIHAKKILDEKILQFLDGKRLVCDIGEVPCDYYQKKKKKQRRGTTFLLEHLEMRRSSWIIQVVLKSNNKCPYKRHTEEKTQT